MDGRYCGSRGKALGAPAGGGWVRGRWWFVGLRVRFTPIICRTLSVVTMDVHHAIDRVLEGNENSRPASSPPSARLKQQQRGCGDGTNQHDMTAIYIRPLPLTLEVCTLGAIGEGEVGQIVYPPRCNLPYLLYEPASRFEVRGAKAHTHRLEDRGNHPSSPLRNDLSPASALTWRWRQLSSALASQARETVGGMRPSRSLPFCWCLPPSSPSRRGYVQEAIAAAGG